MSFSLDIKKFLGKRGGKGEKGEREEAGEGGMGREERKGREERGGEMREGKIAKGTQWQKQHLTVKLFDAPMIKVSFVFRSLD